MLIDLSVKNGAVSGGSPPAKTFCCRCAQPSHGWDLLDPLLYDCNYLQDLGSPGVDADISPLHPNIWDIFSVCI